MGRPNWERGTAGGGVRWSGKGNWQPPDWLPTAQCPAVSHTLRPYMAYALDKIRKSSNVNI